jgi:CheY-like chemotaxis protein
MVAFDPEAAGQPVATPIRIMVIDDDRDTAETTSTLLSLDGHEVESAFDGRTALQRISHFVPDLVFVDLIMPDIDGIEVAKAIRGMTLANEPVLAAHSGLITPRIKRQCAAAGFDHFLTKPLDVPVLEQVVHLARANSTLGDAFNVLVARYEASVCQFTWSQLEFCRLALLSMPRLPREKRQAQLVRLHRIITLASGWLSLQKRMPILEKQRMTLEIDKLRVRLALFKD